MNKDERLGCTHAKEGFKMKNELDPRLKVCWELAERDRDKTLPPFRRDLDGVFWHLLNLCDTANVNIQEIKADLMYIAGLP